MQAETRKEIYAIVQAVCGVVCAVVAVWGILHPAMFAQLTASQNTPGASPVNNSDVHIAWWYWPAIGGLVLCALTSILGTVVGLWPRKSKLTILKAVYGAGSGTDVDVTKKLQKMKREAIVIPVDNSLAPDPAYGVRKRLAVEYSYSYGDAVVHYAERPESTPTEVVRLILPEDPEVKRLMQELKRRPKEEATNKIPASTDKPLRERVFILCGELKQFLDKHGKCPDPYKIPMSDKNEYMRIYNETTQAWVDKFQADYWKNYSARVEDIRHKLALNSLTDNALDKRLMEAKTAELNEGTVSRINDGLRQLAAKL